jgi:plasmid stability protein
MPVSLSIKNVPDALAARLRERALANHRSLQGELMAMLDSALAGTTAEQARAHYVAAPISAAQEDPDPGRALMKLVAKISPAQAAESVRLVRDMREERTEHLMRLIEREGAMERARQLLGLPPKAKGNPTVRSPRSAGKSATTPKGGAASRRKV